MNSQCDCAELFHPQYCIVNNKVFRKKKGTRIEQEMGKKQKKANTKYKIQNRDQKQKSEIRNRKATHNEETHRFFENVFQSD